MALRINNRIILKVSILEISRTNKNLALNEGILRSQFGHDRTLIKSWWSYWLFSGQNKLKSHRISQEKNKNKSLYIEMEKLKPQNMIKNKR